MNSPSVVTRMSLCVLGSGSGGNCSALALDDTQGQRRVTLIDLGLSPRQTKLRLDQVGLSLDQVEDVLITHFDQDHYRHTWTKKARDLGWTIRFHKRHLGWARRAGAAYVRSEPFDDAFDFENGLAEVRPISFIHDHQGTTGYRIETAAGSLGYATDLGRTPRTLKDAFAGVNVLAIESNYCPQLQHESPRPDFLKRRIMGGRGHLSNHEALDLIRRVDAVSPDLRQVVLLHLSRQCNCPQRVLDLYAKEAPDLAPRVMLTSQSEATDWVRVENGAGRPRARICTRTAAAMQQHLFAGQLDLD
ncbi:MAG: MBL fold metallo-hydrolase [Phycisphaerales bacterium]